MGASASSMRMSASASACVDANMHSNVALAPAASSDEKGAESVNDGDSVEDEGDVTITLSPDDDENGRELAGVDEDVTLVGLAPELVLLASSAAAPAPAPVPALAQSTSSSTSTSSAASTSKEAEKRPTIGARWRSIARRALLASAETRPDREREREGKKRKGSVASVMTVEGVVKGSLPIAIRFRLCH